MVNKRILGRAVAGLVAVAALAVPAIAGPLTSVDALKEWNLIVLGDLTSSSEVEGRTFVGGDLNGNSSNYMIRVPSTSVTDEPGLTVVGDVNGGTKNLNNGSGAIVGGNVNSGFNLNGDPQTVLVGGTISNTNVNSNTVTSGLSSSSSTFLSDLELQKSVLTSSLTDLSTSLSGLTATSTVDISGNRATFNATPNSDGLAVFNITSDQLNSIGEIAFNLNGADTVIVNVSGTDITLNDNFLGGTNGLGEHVIWNFPDAENLALTTAWGGSVLAPNADATTSNYIQGSAVFGSLTQNGEMHLGTYSGNYVPSGSSSSSSSGGSSGDPTSVPEAPTTLLFLLGAGGVAALVAARRRRKNGKAA